jgi:hypothetical protein
MGVFPAINHNRIKNKRNFENAFKLRVRSGPLGEMVHTKIFAP